MSLQTWLWFCATETVLSFAPGPAVLLVVSLSLTRGATAGIAGTLGILAANAVYFMLSATSLGALLLASYRLFLVIKWAGAAYLVWMGLRMALSRVATSGAPSVEPSGQSRRRAFSLAFLTQGANPKALIFFTAILPQFIDPRARVPFQIGVLGVSSIALEFVVLTIYVVTCRTARAWIGETRLASPLQRAGGVLLVAAGARLAAFHRA
jgi:threonine/homoserine/homoserine lactone efflux protein